MSFFIKFQNPQIILAAIPLVIILVFILKREFMKFKDKIVLVTGSSRGIGRATAIAFAQEGANVVVNYVKNKKNFDDTSKDNDFAEMKRRDKFRKYN